MIVGQVYNMTVALSPGMPQDMMGKVTKIEPNTHGVLEVTISKPWTVVMDPQTKQAQIMPVSNINPMIKDDVVVPYDKISLWYTPKDEIVQKYIAARAGIQIPNGMPSAPGPGKFPGNN